MKNPVSPKDMKRRGFLPQDRFAVLLKALRTGGVTEILAPVQREGAWVYGPIDSVEEIARGGTDEQKPGFYRYSEKKPGEAAAGRFFAYGNGPQSLKAFTFAPREILWHCTRNAAGQPVFTAEAEPNVQTAVIGVRACDLAALALQEQHFLFGKPGADSSFQRRRAALFLVAVHCTHPAATCFCASTGDGPAVRSGFDWALSEIDEGFIVEVGSERGAALLAELDLPQPSREQEARAAEEIRWAGENQSRALPDRNLRDRLYAELENPHWDRVGQRCLACGNCTAVCPTCFCHAEQDEPEFGGARTTHYRQWDSCFTATHSFMGHFLVREETRLRYRQWLTHKLAAWHDQFGRSGCVGCGRCITWCPAGIDLTEEVPRLLSAGDALSDTAATVDGDA